MQNLLTNVHDFWIIMAHKKYKKVFEKCITKVFAKTLRGN